MLRSYHGNARWTHPPHDFAEEVSSWRCFRHLSYKAIRSYLVAFEKEWDCGYKCSLNDGQISSRHGLTAPEAWRGWRAAKEDGHVGFGFARVWMRKPRYIPNPDPRIYYDNCLFETKWMEHPRKSMITNKIAMRLGISCVVCGKITRGISALTKNLFHVNAFPIDFKRYWCRERRVFGLVGVERKGGRFIWGDVDEFWHDAHINPLCADCAAEVGDQKRIDTIAFMMEKIAKRVGVKSVA